MFIKDTVIREIKEMTKRIDKAKTTQVEKCDPTFQQRMAQGAVNFIESYNTFIAKFWGITSKHRISVGSMSLILRNTLLSKEERKRFRDEYKDPKVKVSFEEVLKFLAH